jgi:CxxC-x17-CxxC domain-containing protein
MGNFDRDSRDRGPRKFGGRSFGGGRKFGGGGSDRPTMHDATCDKCGKDCQVPFRPTGDRPVFCSDCFGSQGGSDRPRFRDNDRAHRFGGDKQMFDAVCTKCGKDCQVPFRPTGTKPVFCSQCFDRGGSAGGGRGGNDGQKDQFAILNSKLDKIMKALNINAIEKTEKKPEVKPEVKKEKEEVKKEEKTPAKKKAPVKKVAKKKSK